jgi:tight adherence protein B
MSITIVTLLCFASASALVAALAPPLMESRKTRLESRLRDMAVGRRVASVSNSITKNGDGARLFAIFKAGFGRRFDRVVLLFDQPDSSLTVNGFLVSTVGCAAFGVAAAAIGNLARGYYLGLALAAGSLPLIWLVIRRRRHLQKFGRQLPDALELLARAMRTGHSLPAGMRCIAEDMLPPVGMEFGLVCERMNLGVTLDQAFDDMLRRIPNRDLKFFVTALKLHRQTGGNLTEVLDNISRIVRERLQIMGQVKALTGEGRISGLVLMSLPIMVGGGVYYLNPEYVLLLVRHPIGQQMLEVAIVLQVLGVIAIRKIVNIKI